MQLLGKMIVYSLVLPTRTKKNYSELFITIMSVCVCV